MFRPSSLIPARKAHDPATTAGMGGRSVLLSLLQRVMAPLLLLSLSLLPATAAVTPAGTTIDNIATATFGGGQSATSNPVRIVTVAPDTPAVIDFLRYAPGLAGSEELPVPPTSYLTGGEPVPIPPLGTGDGPVPLTLAPLYHAGEFLYLRVTDLDENLDASRAETVLVTVLCVETGDSEILLLTESGPDTGIFTGYLPTMAAGNLLADGRLLVTTDAHLTATYRDRDDTADTISTASLIDPYGIVFDSSTGEPVNGATVTIIDTTTGRPARVFADDGVSPFPSTVTTGDPAYGFPPGGFRFPFVSAGSYRFAVTPPSAWTPPPSTVPFDELQRLPGAPFSLTTGSLGETFVLNPGPAIHIDIPVDPRPSQLWVEKSVNVEQAAIGDFIQYRLRVANSGELQAVQQVALDDRLPAGFRYQQGSLRINGSRVADPQIGSDGRTLHLPLGTLAASDSVSIAYVTEITVGASPGTAVNTAQATGANGVRSNQAKARVLVRNDFFGSKAFLAGRVVIGACDEEDLEKPGLAGIRLYLEDGSYVLTDENGRYHFEAIEPGVHVVQIDLDTLPGRYELLPCEPDTQSAGRTYSRFVDVQGGTLWRADFHVGLKPPPRGEARLTLQSSLADNQLQLRLPLAISGMVDLANLRLSLILPAGTSYLAGSSRMGESPLADPEGGGQVVTYRLGDRPAGWAGDISLRVRISNEVSGDLPVKAVLTCDLPEKKNLRGPMAENLLRVTAGAPAQISVVAGDSGPQPLPVVGLHPGETLAPARAVDMSGKNDMPTFGEGWMDTVKPGIAWLWPLPEAVPAIASAKVAIQHLPSQKVALSVDGHAVSPLAFDGLRRGGNGAVAVSIWKGIDIVRGDNRFEAVITDEAGSVVERLQRVIHYSYAPAHAEFLPEQSRLVADGKTPPVIAVRFTDQDGYPASSGMVGDFALAPPYLAYVDREQPVSALDASRRAKFQVGDNGIARILLEPTSHAGEAVLVFPFEERPQELRAWLKPAARDWILVGFAQGTAGYNTLSDNAENARAAGIEEDAYTDGQVKFFAKGAIKGDWLLTLAYDSDKRKLDGDSLQQVIDPDTYYPLYGDATLEGYEAPSARNIFVKLERDQFYALFGDMQTGLNQTVLSRYSRSMNGFKSELQGERFAYTVFAADTTQSFVKDEIRGDGTSGRYPLSQRKLVINSEEVVIETRDRFHNERVISATPLSRHLDYDIDYDAGTLYFKRPVPSKDENLNPVFIVVRYETQASSSANLTYGGRVAARSEDRRVEAGASLVHEDNGIIKGDLYGADLTVQLAPQTTLKAEVATSDIDGDTASRQGDAYLAQIEHSSNQANAIAWFRQQDAGFGLGQQNRGTNGMRSYGVNGEYRFTPAWSLAGEAYHEDNLETEAKRDAATLEGRYQSDHFNLRTGLREARDSFAQGTDERSRQLLLGGDWSSPDRRLVLRASHEQALGNSGKNRDYPTRTLLGADYMLTEQLSVFAEQELTWGDSEDTQGTRVGFKAMPWQGGEIRTSVEQRLGENSQRVFALFGLGQNWQLDSHWSIDLSVDRSYTFKNDQSLDERVNPAVPPASGGHDDFTAVSVGAAYRAVNWSWWNRLETRQGELEDKVGISTGLVGEVDKGTAVSARLMAFITDSANGGKRDEEEITLGMAYRPDRSKWIILEKLDASLYSESSHGADSDGMRIINHIHANYRASRQWQTSLYYGLKYVRENFNGDHYHGYTDMLAVETRYNINERWDVGVHGAVLHSWDSDNFRYSCGGDIGFLAMTNAWISAGYNVAGFEDEDFDAASYTAEGPYVRFRMKFDQQSVKEAAEWLAK